MPGSSGDIGRLAKYVIMTLELILAALLSIGVLVASVKTAPDILKLIRSEEFEKTVFLHLLDSVLLIVLAIDVTRTLLTAILEEMIPVTIVIEAAMLAVLREFIAIEIRAPPTDLLAVLVLVFTALVTAWIIIGLLEARHWKISLRGVRRSVEKDCAAETG